MRINFRRCRESNSRPPDKVKRKRKGRVALYLSSVGPCMVAPSLDRLVAVAIFDNNTLPTLSQSQYIHQSNRPSAWLTCTRNGARLTTPVLKLFKRSTDLTKWSCDKLEILWQPKWFEHPGFWSCGPRREWCSRSSAWSAPPCWRRGHRSWWRECPATPLQTANVNENCLLRPFLKRGRSVTSRKQWAKLHLAQWRHKRSFSCHHNGFMKDCQFNHTNKGIRVGWWATKSVESSSKVLRQVGTGIQ